MTSLVLAAAVAGTVRRPVFVFATAALVFAVHHLLLKG